MARAAIANQRGQHLLDAPQVDQLPAYICELLLSELARVIAMRSVVQGQQARHFVEAEAQALRCLYETHPCDIRWTIAADAAVGLVGFAQQAPSLLEPQSLHIDPGRLRERTDGQT